MRRHISAGRARMAAAAAIVTGVTAAALAVATPAQARWTPITTLTARNWEGVNAAISVDKAGDFLTAWSGINNADPRCSIQTQIRIRFRSGKLGKVKHLTSCGQPGTVFPVVASNASGYGIAAWISDTTAALQARMISPAGKLGPLITVTPKGHDADLVNVAMSPSGQALVTWHESFNSLNGIWARFIGRNSVPRAVRHIDGASSQLPAVVFDKTGTATIGWASGFGDASMARRLTAKHMGKGVKIFGPKPGTGYGVPKLAEDSHGDTFALATTGKTVRNKNVEHLLFRKWSKSGALGRVVTIASPVSTVTATNIADGPSLAADGAGNAVVAWDSALSDSKAAVWGRRVSPAGKLGPKTRLGTGYLPKVAVDPAGAGLVTWQPVPYGSPFPSKIFGRRTSAKTGEFGKRIQFTGDGGYASIAAGPEGVFGVIWAKSSLGWFIQARFGR